MASIQKRGNSYRVTVSNGYDINGKKIVETDTFTPEPGMKPKEIQKALAEFVPKNHTSDWPYQNRSYQPEDYQKLHYYAGGKL